MSVGENPRIARLRNADSKSSSKRLPADAPQLARRKRTVPRLRTTAAETRCVGAAHARRGGYRRQARGLLELLVAQLDHPSGILRAIAEARAVLGILPETDDV